MRRAGRTVVWAAVLAVVALLIEFVGPASAQAYWPKPTVSRVTQFPKSYADFCHSLAPTTRVSLCKGGRYGADLRVLIIGDSHAAHWQPAISVAGKKYGFAVRSLTKSSCPAADVRVWRVGRFYSACSIWRKQVFAKLARGDYGKFDLVILSAFADNQILDSRGRIASGSTRSWIWRAGLIRTVTAVRKVSPKVLIIRDAPHLRRDTMSCLRRYWPYNAVACATPARIAVNSGVWWAERSVAGSMSRVYTADYTTAYCKRGRCLAVDRGLLAFRDEHHWSRVYSERVLSQLVGPRIWSLIRPLPAPAPSSVPAPEDAAAGDAAAGDAGASSD